MALKITKASDPIEVRNITMCLYGVPGLGKTSTAFTAEKPLLLDFDHGSYRSGNRGDVVEVESWSDVTNITPADLAPYKTIIVDTAGRALDCLTADIIDRNPKDGRGGSLTLQGYGVLKGQFTGWLRAMRGFGLDVVLIAHSNEERKGDELIERLDAQGSSKNEIYKTADVMGRLYLAGAVRTLNFSPTDTAFGKNPGQLPPLAVPDFGQHPNYLAGVIAGIKASLNKLSVEQKAAHDLQATWVERIGKAESCSDFDALVALATEEKAPRAIGVMVAQAAKTKGFAWNKATKAYDVAVVQPPKGEAPGSSGSAPGAHQEKSSTQGSASSATSSTSKKSTTGSADTSTRATTSPEKAA